MAPTAVGDSSECFFGGAACSGRAEVTTPDAGSYWISITGPLSMLIGTPGAGVIGRGGPSEMPMAGDRATAERPAGGVASRAGTPVEAPPAPEAAVAACAREAGAAHAAE